MNIKYIRIEFELEKNDLQAHATLAEFKDGMWIANGPVYSRISAAFHEVWKLLRGTK